MATYGGIIASEIGFRPGYLANLSSAHRQDASGYTNFGMILPSPPNLHSLHTSHHLSFDLCPETSPSPFPSIYLLIIISMSSTREEIPPRRKRQHTEAGLSLDNSSDPSKRLKSSRAEFYDSLSKVWLTRRALKELDRQTRQANSPQRPAPPSQRVYPEETSKQKRFARHGGSVPVSCQPVSDKRFSGGRRKTESASIK
jgi:hypothetical protein